MSELRDVLEALVANEPYSSARSILRIAAAVESKSDPSVYWSDRGRSRFERELQADGLPPDVVRRALDSVDEVLGGAVIRDEVTLDAILEDLRRREASALDRSLHKG